MTFLLLLIFEEKTFFFCEDTFDEVLVKENKKRMDDTSKGTQNVKEERKHTSAALWEETI